MQQGKAAMRIAPAAQLLLYPIFCRIFVLLTLLAVTLCPCDASTAVTEERHAGDGENCYSVIFLENIPVFRLLAKSEEELNREVSLLKKKLAELMTPLPSPGDISVHIRGNDAIILIRGKTLYAITPASASVQGKTPYSVAKQWARNLQDSLGSLKSWSLSASELLIPLGEERIIRLMGKAEGTVSLQEYDSSIIEAHYDIQGRMIRIRALSTGYTPLWVQKGGMRKRVTVAVRKGAGTLPSSVKVIVTGRGTPGREIISRALLATIDLLAKKERGAYLVINRAFLEQMDSLNEGESRSITVPASLKGDEYITLSKEIQVQITAAKNEREQVATLFISNNPEKINRAGVLMSEALPVKGSTRFLFHHMNSPDSEARKLLLRLVNNGSEECSVHIIHSMVGPSTDEIYSGHLATSLFWEQWQNDRGYVITIPSGNEFIVGATTIKSGQIVSGLSNFTALEGPPPQVVLEARGGTSVEAIDTGDRTRVKGMFLKPEIAISKSHVIGRGFTFVYLGGKPYVREKSTGRENVGNYGVVYTIDIEIENPYDEENEAEIVFTPGGGPARGVFLMDNRLIETPMAAHLQEIAIQKYVLAPYEKKKITLTTFPQSGSNYPVRIVVKSRMIP
jgi:hypothetical protein